MTYNMIISACLHRTYAVYSSMGGLLWPACIAHTQCTAVWVVCYGLPASHICSVQQYGWSAMACLHHTYAVYSNMGGLLWPACITHTQCTAIWVICYGLPASHIRSVQQYGWSAMACLHHTYMYAAQQQYGWSAMHKQVEILLKNGCVPRLRWFAWGEEGRKQIYTHTVYTYMNNTSLTTLLHARVNFHGFHKKILGHLL